MKNILVVGCGFTGAVIARELAEAGHSVRVIDIRDHIAGNAYDSTNEIGLRVHRYGPHLFHTKHKDIWDYLGKFTEWVPYLHEVKALLEDGRYATLPVNRETKEMVGAENVLDIFFKPYTLKMWGIPLEELDPSIMNRVPIRDDDNTLYFPNDPYQGLPKDGYTELIRKMLDHPGITVRFPSPFHRSMEDEFDHVFNSMPIDVYYDYKFGKLEYRSVKFHTVNVPLPAVLPSATVNFTHDGPYTRVTEWQKLPAHGKNPFMSTVTYEEPCDPKDNDGERYYPVKDLDGKNREAYLAYRDIPNDKVTFVGRCGLFVYTDMDGAVSMALAIARKFIKNNT